MLRMVSVCLALLLAVPALAVELGDDGLHKADWIRDTFKDLGEDLAEANAEGKRLLVIVEQRGCIYCTKMHEDVFVEPEIHDMLMNQFFVVRVNLHGDTEVIDFDGEALSEKDAARKWGVMFTPNMIFLPEEVADGQNAQQASVAIMPGAFGKGTTLDFLTWVLEKRYEIKDGEDFQRYHARMIQERNDGSTN